MSQSEFRLASPRAGLSLDYTLSWFRALSCISCLPSISFIRCEHIGSDIICCWSLGKKELSTAVNSQFTIQLGNEIEVVSIITKQSAERLEVSVGKTVFGTM